MPAIKPSIDTVLRLRTPAAVSFQPLEYPALLCRSNGGRAVKGSRVVEKQQ